MKNLFKYAACLFAAAVAFASCNHETGDDDDNVTYPQTLTLGNWVSESTNDTANSYFVSLSIGAKGDTVCTLVKQNLATGKYGSSVTSKCTYNPLVGMVTADFSDSPEAGRPSAEVYVAWQHTFDAMTVRYRTYVTNRDTKTYTERVTFRGVSCAGVPIVNTEYYSADETWGVAFSDDGTCGYMMGEESGEGVYAFDYATGTGSITVVNNTVDKTPTGEVLSLSTNSLNQLVLSSATASMPIFRQ